MSFLLPLLPSLISAGAGLYGNYKQQKAERRAERRGPREERTSLLNPQQQHYYDLINSIITGEGEGPKGGLLGELFGDQGFDAYADPAIRKFNEEIAPNIAERYSAGLGIPGAAGAQRSSAFQNALSHAGSQLAQSLGEFRQRQRMEALSGLTNQFLKPTEDITLRERHGQSPIGRGLGQFGGAGASGVLEQLTGWLQDKYGSGKTTAGGMNPSPSGFQTGSYIDRYGNITGPMYR